MFKDISPFKPCLELNKQSIIAVKVPNSFTSIRDALGTISPFAELQSFWDDKNRELPKNQE
jgi:hypothetical protein